MQVTLQNNTFQYPSTLQELTIGQWMEFYELYGRTLDEYHAELLAMEPGALQQIGFAELAVERAYCLAAFFSNTDLDDAKSVYTVGETLAAYNECYVPLFKEMPAIQNEHKFMDGSWVIPVPVLLPGTKIEFGEFIDGKVVAQSISHLKLTKWHLLYRLCAIFFRPDGELYDPNNTLDGSERLKHLQELPLDVALQVGEFWDQLNTFCQENFTVFRRSSIKTGKHAAKHFERWGWVNFLKTIASTKVFDITNSGLNSIDCARRTNCFDVLVYASEDKEMNEAMAADMEAKK